MINIERAIFNTETTLSKIAAYPVIGTAAGIAKVGMGASQMVASVATAILMVPPSICSSKAREVLHFSARHIVHGAGNIAAGILEAIPVVQTLLYKAREYNQAKNSDTVSLINGQESKFLGYKLLAEKDQHVVNHLDGWSINGENKSSITVDEAKKLNEDAANYLEGAKGIFDNAGSIIEKAGNATDPDEHKILIEQANRLTQDAVKFQKLGEESPTVDLSSVAKRNNWLI